MGTETIFLKMTSKNPLKTLDALESKLLNKVREDKLYQLQNDAKFRAVNQQVPTYDDFEQMVKGSHLKALDPKKEKIEAVSYQYWNPEHKREDFHGVGRDNNEITNSDRRLQDEENQPKYQRNAKIPEKLSNFDEILRKWKSLTSFEDQCDFIRNSVLQPENNNTFLSTVLDKDSTFLESLVNCFRNNWPSSEKSDDSRKELFKRCLEVLKKSKQFDLAVMMFDDDDNEVFLEQF